VQHTRSILVVDNESTIVDLIVEILTDEGYVAYAAPDGGRALAAITHQTPALILLDWRMPGMSGAELIAHARGTGVPTGPIVLITASPHEAKSLLAAESIECLSKPFHIDDLLACVARYVQPDQAIQSLELARGN
jgi:CheY-like chemotaxis protein